MLFCTALTPRTLIGALSLAASASLWAADPVTDALQQAYAPYRAAFFKTNTGSQADSQRRLPGCVTATM